MKRPLGLFTQVKTEVETENASNSLCKTGHPFYQVNNSSTYSCGYFSHAAQLDSHYVFGAFGFPKVFGFDESSESNAIVMELLRSSLGQAFDICFWQMRC